jgi:hypothetical protein
MSPLPRPVNCPHPRLVKLVQFKGEHVSKNTRRHEPIEMQNDRRDARQSVAIT